MEEITTIGVDIAKMFASFTALTLKDRSFCARP